MMITAERNETADGVPAVRRVPRRRRLASGRAVAGAFLVAASATGALALAGTGSSTPSTSYVIAAGDIAAGERLSASHLEVVALDLAPGQRRVSFERTGDLLGAVTLGHLAEGELVHVSDVARPAEAPERAQLSIPVDAARALNGRLRAGEMVDVIATFTDGGSTRTQTVSAGAVVVEVASGSEGLGRGGTLIVTLAVPPSHLEAVAEAASTAEVFLARTTGVDRD